MRVIWQSEGLIASEVPKPRLDDIPQPPLWFGVTTRTTG